MKKIWHRRAVEEISERKQGMAKDLIRGIESADYISMELSDEDWLRLLRG